MFTALIIVGSVIGYVGVGLHAARLRYRRVRTWKLKHISPNAYSSQVESARRQAHKEARGAALQDFFFWPVVVVLLPLRGALWAVQWLGRAYVVSPVPPTEAELAWEAEARRKVTEERIKELEKSTEIVKKAEEIYTPPELRVQQYSTQGGRLVTAELCTVCQARDELAAGIGDGSVIDIASRPCTCGRDCYPGKWADRL